MTKSYKERRIAAFDTFIREALNVGFTDSQINFLYKWFWDENENKMKELPTID